ncbi:MAG: glycosyltransferase [Clostridia bacterium]|nr:glycosyltransferase [Clostridia bacterium]
MEAIRPKISIVIPAYKASNYLAEAIDSALAQTYDNYEIIVVNDGSPDEGATRAVAGKYGDKIRYFEKENGGSSSALNRGIKEMQGEWFSWLSHDDLYKKDKLSEQVKLLNQLYEKGEVLENHILFTGSELVNAQGKVISTPKEKDLLKIAEHIDSITDNKYLIAEPTRYNFHGCGCLIHKSVLDKMGGFDEKLRLINDVDLWYRLYEGGYKLHFIPKVLVQGRVHAKQLSTQIGYSYHNPEQDMFWNRCLNWLKDNAKDDYELFVLYGKNAYLKTRYKEGDDAFAMARSLKPKKSFGLWIIKTKTKTYSKLRNLAKKLYLKLRVGKAK